MQLELRRCFSLIVGLAVMLACGCGAEKVKRPPLGKVKGVVTYKGNPVSDAIVTFAQDKASRMSVGMTEGDGVRNFYPLSLERDKIMFFPSSWTVVHPIDENSPLYGLDKAAFDKARPEFLVLIQGFDDTFDQTINARVSYTDEEVVWGAKFVKIGGLTEDGKPTVDLGRLESYTREELPVYTENSSAKLN